MDRHRKSTRIGTRSRPRRLGVLLRARSSWHIAAFEADAEALFRAFIADLPAIDGVSHSTQTITGFDGNDIAFYISRPVEETGALPGVLHIHGGGMVALSATGAGYVRLRDAIAQIGVVVIGVEFRNGAARWVLIPTLLVSMTALPPCTGCMTTAMHLASRPSRLRENPAAATFHWPQR